jgi:N-acetylglucosamine kinase-like BadF-type ATPase
MGSGAVTNTGITGISSNGVGGGGSTTAVAVNTTVKNFVGVSYSSAATTTTCTFQMAIVEVVKA